MSWLVADRCQGSLGGVESGIGALQVAADTLPDGLVHSSTPSRSTACANGSPSASILAYT
jgi:hypothetical protein